MSVPGPRDLVTPEADALREALEALPDTSDPAALAAVRRAHPEADPALLGALATQVRLRRRALDRLGPWAGELVLDDEALQQASRRDVALYRAGSLVARLSSAEPGRSGSAGPPGAHPRVADLGCGLGLDSRALAEAGCAVLAIEQDPWRAEAAEVNLARVHDRARVVCADATELAAQELQACAAAYVDPARRASGGPRRADGGRSRAVADPRAWSPPWPWVVSLAERMPVVAKTAPGLDPRHVPADADLEWVDHDGETVETSVWFAPLGAGRRIATALAGERIESLEAPRAEPPRLGPTTVTTGRLLLEPTAAIGRARLLAPLAEHLGAQRLDAGGWLTADARVPTLLARAWRVAEEVPHGARDLRAWLRGRGSVTWKTADADVAATQWDARVGHRPSRDGTAVTIVITGQGRAFSVEREPEG